MVSECNHSRGIFLKPLLSENVSKEYVDWMNDPEVTRYLESRDREYTLSELQRYVQQVNASPSNYLYGIFLMDSNQHIGNIKIGDIHPIHKFANLGLLIGEKKCWGRGFGTESIILATRIAFEEFGLQSLTAGIYSNNIASYRAFIKAGWEDVGRFKKYRLFEGKYIDQINIQVCRE